MSVTAWIAVLVIILSIYFLIKRYEPRLILFTAGMFLYCCALNPIGGLNQFASQMTNSLLIQAICSSMGFAFIVSHTGCDRHLVTLLVRPLKKVGIFILPAATIVTAFINVALPTAAGCAAAVGTTFIPVLVRAGMTPAGAGAAVLMGTYGSLVSPGVSHNAFIADISHMELMDFIFLHSPYSLMVMAIGAIGITFVGLAFKDNHPPPEQIMAYDEATGGNVQIEKVSLLKAFAPILPLLILVLGNTCLPVIKMGVAQAMLIGTIYALAVCRVNPQTFTREFCKGMGTGYANVLGLIIAASVFAGGLTASGLVGAFVDLLKSSNEFARWGGSIGPFIMSLLTGSGDAAILAFNQAVTPHAEEFGMHVPNLGALALITGCLGRTMSPIAAVTIVVSGLSATPPLALCKRTAIPMIVALFVTAFVMV